MKHSNPAFSSMFFKKIFFLLLLFAACDLAIGQACDTPVSRQGPGGSYTNENVPASFVVTRYDLASSSLTLPFTPDSLSIYQNPGHGTVIVLNDSTVLYTPDTGYTGTDHFEYRICNACGNCTIGTFYIGVSFYCPPPAPAADHYTVYNNVPTAMPVTANDTNVDASPLTVTALQQPRHGTVTGVLDSAVYNDNGQGYVGLDTFKYQVCDTCPGGNNCSSAFVYLNVITCQPVIVHTDTFYVQQQSSISRTIDANDLNTSGFGNATLTLLGTPKFGGADTLTGSMITYSAGSDGYGPDSVRYRICTDCGCDSGYAVFNVTEKPCAAPVAGADTEYAGYYPTCINIFNILVNDTFPINGLDTVLTLVGTPLFGKDTIINNQLVYTCTDSTKKDSTDMVRYSICNACRCDTGIVAIHITSYPCNGLNPVVMPDAASVCRNYATVINVTANDYSPQGLTVSASAIATQPQHGHATVVSANDIRYAPAANYSGPDYFEYQACDNGIPSLCDTARVSVLVNMCNAPPLVLNPSGLPTDTLYISVREDSSRLYCFSINQQDSPYVYISYVSQSADTIIPTAGSDTLGLQPCMEIIPANNSRTTQTVQVVICNAYPVCDTIQVIISVIPVDHAPIAVNDTLYYVWPGCIAVNVLRKDIDIDPGDHITLTAFSATTVNGGAVVQETDSVLCYLSDSFFAGTDTFRYMICDTSGMCASALVVVYVPLLARPDEAITRQDSSVLINVTANDTRTNTEYLSLCAIPLHGAVVIDSGGIRYTPDHDYPLNPINPDTNSSAVGIDSFCYTLCSVSGADTTCTNAEVYVTIMPKGVFYIPQGISPNGDGVNDQFVIVSSDEFPLSQLLVYDRYGDEVWRNDGGGYQNNFDGTWKKNGQPLPDGSYWYIFKFNDGITQDRLGYIVIQR